MTEEEKWIAVRDNDRAADGSFFYGVQSTGVFCRPSCPSRRPKREGVVFFDTAQQAQATGFRPCKRCQPDLEAHQPEAEMAVRMQALLQQDFADKRQALRSIKELGLSANRAAQIFKAQVGSTPSAFVDTLRARYAIDALAQGTPVLEVAQQLGFESLSAFYAFHAKHAAGTPGRHRRSAAQAQVPAQACYAYESPIGPLTLRADEDALTGLDFGPPPTGASLRPNAITDRAAEELRQYFAGERTDFTVPLRPKGTDFQQKVWAALRTVPYGATRTYGQIAAQIGQPTASRAVGMANNRNPIAILIPCHRVVGASGELVGYAGGLDVKRLLLELESRSTTPQFIQGEFDL